VKIYYAGTPEVPFNKPRAEAEAMIAAGIAVAYVEPASVRRPDAQFAVHVWSLDKQPYIGASCSGCGNKAQFSGPNAHKTQVFRHCGVTNQIPEDVAAEYAERRSKWKPKPVAPEAVAEKLPSFELTHF
jgi:hypothetical protein